MMATFGNSNFENDDAETSTESDTSERTFDMGKLNQSDVFVTKDSAKAEEKKKKKWGALDFEDTSSEKNSSSQKSFSLLQDEGSPENSIYFSEDVAHFPAATTEEDEDDFLNDFGFSNGKAKLDKSVQTDILAKSYLCENESATFLEATIKIKNILVNYTTSSSGKTIVDILKRYFPVPVSGNALQRCKSSDAIVAGSFPFVGDGFREHAQLLQTVAKRLKRCDKTIRRYESEDDSHFDFDNFHDSSILVKRKKTDGQCNDEILEKSLEIILTLMKHWIKEDSTYLGLVWKNSHVENGMKLLNEVFESDLKTVDFRVLIFNFFKNSLDPFENDESSNLNQRLEFKASFVTVTCQSPALCLDLIRFCVEICLYSKRHYQSSASGDKKKSSVIFVEKHFAFYRLLKNLLEKFANCLKDNSVDFSAFQKNVPKNSWKIEEKNMPGNNENFATMVERLLRDLNDLVSFSKNRFPLTTLIVSECYAIVRDIHKAALNIYKFPVKNKKNFDFYSCTF